MSINKYIHRSNRTTTTPSTLGFGRLYNNFAATQRTARYGALYNYAALENLPNVGWKVPDYFDVSDSLMESTGGELKATGYDLWDYPNTLATDTTGFAAVGGGYRRTPSGYISKNTTAIYWIYESITFDYKFFYLQKGDGVISFDQGDANLTDGYSVRLCKLSTTLTEENPHGTYTGNDGRIYKTVLINGIEWMAENLAETKYNTGSTIPIVENQSTWDALTTGAMCYYDNDKSNESYYLIASRGYRLPFESDFDELTQTAEQLKSDSSSYWNTPGTNAVNFAARGSGKRSGSTGGFSTLKDSFGCWLADPLKVFTIDTNKEVITSTKTTGYAVRLIKETPTAADLLKSDGEYCDNYIGNDGQVYPTVKIGTQVWVAMNLQETKFRTGQTITTVADNDAWTDITDYPLVGADYEGGKIVNISGSVASILSLNLENKTYSEALTYVSALTHEGYSDWELPTNAQWLNIISIKSLLDSDIEAYYFWSKTDIDEFTAYIADPEAATLVSTSKESTRMVRAIRYSDLSQQYASCIYDNSQGNLIEINNLVVHNGLKVIYQDKFVVHNG